MKLKDYRKAIKEYHEFHGDSHVNPFRVIRSEEYRLVVLVRVIDENKIPISILEAVDSFGSIDEITYVDRKDEEKMINDYLSGREEDEDE